MSKAEAIAAALLEAVQVLPSKQRDSVMAHYRKSYKRIAVLIDEGQAMLPCIESTPPTQPEATA